jgi:hypothetical protein
MRDLLGVVLTTVTVFVLLILTAIIAGTWVGIAAVAAERWLP